MKVQDIFKFGKSLPGKLANLESRSASVKSKYNTTSTSTLSISVWKAFHLYALATEPDLPEETKKTQFPELSIYSDESTGNYLSAINRKTDYNTQYALWNAASATIKAGIYDSISDTMETYSVGPSEHDGTAIIAAMIPEILKDDEASEQYNKIKNSLLYLPESDFWLSTNEEFNKSLLILCDNIYRRIAYTATAGTNALNVKLPTTAHLIRINKDVADSMVLSKSIKRVGFGTGTTEKTTEKTEDTSDFDGSYALDPDRIWTEEEKELIPHVQPWYIVPDWVKNICKKFYKSSTMTTPMRNALLKGPSGTGKTEGARAIFAGLGIPYTKTTCSVDSEIFDFLGQVFPTTEDKPLSYKELLEEYHLPSVDDIMFDLEGSYKALTGEDAVPAGYDQAECISLLFDKVMSITATLKENNKEFRYVESELVKAMRNGYGHEIQEPTVIKRAGVLVGLNALFENGDNNFVTLPTGEVIKKHPNCCIILTTNSDYEGCAILNQSVLSRMDIVKTIDMPSVTEMKRRIVEKTGFDNDDVLDRMIEVVLKINEFCKEKDITDGSCGMRELESWVKAVMIEADSMIDIDDSIVYDEALDTIISKATQNRDDEEQLVDACLRLKFAA